MQDRPQDMSPANADAKSDQRHRRAETLLNAKKTLELAEKLKLVSLNVAIESAKTRGGAFEIQRLKQELSDLTNQAVKSSKEISELIESISDMSEADAAEATMVTGVRSTQGSASVEFRKAVRLRKDLDELLAHCSDAIDRLERMSAFPHDSKRDRSEL